MAHFLISKIVKPLVVVYFIEIFMHSFTLRNSLTSIKLGFVQNVH